MEWRGKAFVGDSELKKASVERKRRAEARMWVFDQLPKDIRNMIDGGTYVNPDAALSMIATLVEEHDDLEKACEEFRNAVTSK